MSSYNKKILRWDNIDFSALVESITEAEMLEMIEWISVAIPWVNPDEFRNDLGYWNRKKVVYAYMKWWLFWQIDTRQFEGAHELFENLMCAA